MKKYKNYVRLESNPEDTKYLFPNLKLDAGLHTLVGMSNSGKTYFIYSLAVSAAMGLPLLDGWEKPQKINIELSEEKSEDLMNPCMLPHVCLLDFEVGLKKTSSKIKRVCNGYGISITDIEENFFYSPCEDIKIEDIYEIIKENDLVIIDNLESLCELLGNTTFEPQIGSKLRKIRALASKCGTCVIIIHHGSKSDNTTSRGIASGSGTMSITNSMCNIFQLREIYENVKEIVHEKHEEEKVENLYLQYDFSNSMFKITQTCDTHSDTFYEKFKDFLKSNVGKTLPKSIFDKESGVPKKAVKELIDKSLSDGLITNVSEKKHPRYLINEMDWS